MGVVALSDQDRVFASLRRGQVFFIFHGAHAVAKFDPILSGSWYPIVTTSTGSMQNSEGIGGTGAFY
jgi:hypothetical protein